MMYSDLIREIVVNVILGVILWLRFRPATLAGIFSNPEIANMDMQAVKTKEPVRVGNFPGSKNFCNAGLQKTYNCS
jgi:hypothetical protein